MQKMKKVVVVGGGFAGIAAVKKLQSGGFPLEIVLISNKSYFEYYPALYKLVTGALAIEVSVPLRTIFPRSDVHIVEETFESINTVEKYILLHGEKKMHYDYCVFALGSETNYFNIPGLSDQSFSFKSVEEALRLKDHFKNLLANASALSKDELVERLHMIVVGGGPSGVELAGDLRTFLTKLAKIYSVDPNIITIDLIESNNRLLPTFSEKVSRVATARLRKMGVNIFTGRTLQNQDVADITMKDMQMKSHTLVWTAGTRISPAFEKIPGATLSDRKRIIVSETLSLPQNPEVFVIGDGAATKYAGLAQTAIVDGTYVGETILREVQGKLRKPYESKAPSFVIPIGNNWALLSSSNFLMTGFLPWILRSAIDFKYFASILPLSYVLKTYARGAKYRHLEKECQELKLATVQVEVQNGK